MALETDETVTEITVDLMTMTLGEMAEVERQSRRSIEEMLTAGKASRRLVALFVHGLRSSGPAPSWHDLSSRPLSARPFSDLPSRPDGPPARSSD
jgi:hypothetical protein